jgi:GNAT superfamily N-acetyltransferase
MIQVETSGYTKFISFFELIPYHTALLSLMEGTTPGMIATDSLNSPSFVIAQCRHRVFLCGQPQSTAIEQISGFLLNTVLENCRQADVPFFRLTASSPEWIRGLEAAMSECAPILSNYQCYRMCLDDTPLPEPTLPDGFHLKKVTKTLVESKFEGKEDLLEEFCSERESVSAFLEHSFGLCAFKEDQLAGWCLSEYNFKNRCEVGIATMPPFQRKGLATGMTRAFLNQARQHQINTVLWHCYASNLGSKRTALSSGFTLRHEGPVLELYLDPAINLAVHCNICFSEKSYEEALSWYEQALDRDSVEAWMAWNAACAAAYLQRKDQAFNLLEKAIALGFVDLDHMTQSEHMTPLKSDPRWAIMITLLTQNLPS